jgi:hypothetical protein
MEDWAAGASSVPVSGRTSPAKEDDEELLDVDESVVFAEGEDK